MLRIAFHREAAPGLPRLLPLHPGAPHDHEARAHEAQACAAGFTGAVGEAASLLPDGPVLVGLGPTAAGGGSEHPWMEAGGQAVLALQRARPGARHALLDARGLEPGLAAALAAGAALRSWRFDALRHAAPEEEAPVLEALDILADDPALALQAWEAQEPAIRGTLLARDLVAEPGNRLNPRAFARRLEALSAEGLQVEVWRRKDLARAGFGALLAVGQGSAAPPRLVVLRWPGEPGTDPVVFVGKGITFDTGGVNLKTQGGIEEMKYDMCGGATVLGTFVAAVGLKLPLNLVVVVPAVENAIDGNAYRPSDVITSMSGRTIEVGNTDAEGRLILCDALTYAERFKPEALVDVATLTGACMIALGRHAAGLMSKHDDLSEELLSAGEHVYDRAWRLPLWDEYQSQLESTFADVYNIGGRWGGAITAGCFLARFTEGQRWAHLDIAGVANDEGKRGMATGRPVNLLAQWLLDRASGAAGN